MTYVSQTIVLYILNLYSTVHQLYLNKTGRKKINEKKRWKPKRKSEKNMTGNFINKKKKYRWIKAYI